MPLTLMICNLIQRLSSGLAHVLILIFKGSNQGPNRPGIAPLGEMASWKSAPRLTLTSSAHGSTMAAVVDIGHPKFRCIRCDSTMPLANGECLSATISNRGDTWLTYMAMPAKS